DCKDDACNKKRDDELKNSKVKAKIFTRLFYRHWSSFTEFKRSHLFVVSADRNIDWQSVRPAGLQPAESNAPGETGTAENISAGPTGQSPMFRSSDAPRDLTPGDHDVPPFHLGGQDMYAISPDGKELAYTSNIDEVGATSTNNEIFVVPMNGDKGKSGTDPKKISTSPGSDSTPLYSPDGKYLGWRSQARADFESDKWRLLLQDRQSGKTRDLTEKFDRSLGSFPWTRDSIMIYFGAEDHGSHPIYRVSQTQQPTEVIGLTADDLIFGANNRLFFTEMSWFEPNEICSLDMNKFNSPQWGKRIDSVTSINRALLSQIEMGAVDSFTFKGANNEDVEGFMVKPPGFDPKNKYPLKLLIHGGPQGAFGNSWTYRWNAELFAATGNYVVVMINFHGSTGYGQEFTDSISGDWGGKPYIDLMKGLDYVENTYPFIDKNREAALGASYGGWMANWLLGHTDRFKCIVSHDGTFNTESMYGTTEELWFPEWEFKGPPWKQRELYRKFSPHLFADKFKTPTLVVHGQNDYRLDVSEGFQLFTTLQRLKVSSKMLYFPDEGHWVLKPQNSGVW